MTNTVRMITWAVHPQYGNPIFWRPHDSLITNKIENESSSSTADTHGRLTWGSNFIGINMASLPPDNQSDFGGFEPLSELYRLWYIQVNPAAFSAKPLHEWAFYSRDRLYRLAVSRDIDLRLLGELALIDKVPSPELGKLLRLHRQTS